MAITTKSSSPNVGFNFLVQLVFIFLFPPDSKKSSSKPPTHEIKYCSDRCRSRKPGARDRSVERKIVALLNSEPDSAIEKTAARTKPVKGDPRVIVTCDEVEEIVFGSRFDPEKVSGRRKNRAARGVAEGEWRSVDMVSSSDDDDGGGDGEDVERKNKKNPADPKAMMQRRDEGDEGEEVTDGGSSIEGGGVRMRPPQNLSDVNFSVGGERGRAEKISESVKDREKRRLGAKRAEEREIVRRAARRLIVFGFEIPLRESSAAAAAAVAGKPAKGKAKSKRNLEEGRRDESLPRTEVRKAEALMAGMVVEPSFAKGNWAVRWRE